MQTPLTISEQDAIDEFLDQLSEETYRQLFRALSPRIFRYFRLRGCERELAEDLTQEVMLAVYTSHRQLRQRDLFRPWMFRIARNLWLQHVRQQGRRVRMSDLGEAPEEAMAYTPDPVRTSCFDEWMALLSPDERDLVLLRYVEGLEYHEIGELLGVPQGTVQWRVFQLKRKLARHFGGEPV